MDGNLRNPQVVPYFIVQSGNKNTAEDEMIHKKQAKKQRGLAKVRKSKAKKGKKGKKNAKKKCNSLHSLHFKNSQSPCMVSK